mgnify:CR=1 FL=1
MTRNELIQAWRDFEAEVQAEQAGKPFDLLTFYNISATPTRAATAGQLVVEFGSTASQERATDRRANGLSIESDEVYRLLIEAGC